jgi:hypothetical protein
MTTQSRDPCALPSVGRHDWRANRHAAQAGQEKSVVRERAICFASSGLGIAALAWGYRENGDVAVALALLLFGVLWLVAQWRWPRVCGWFSALGLVVTAAAAAAGLILGAPSGWMIAGALGGLLAWDLTDLGRRLRFATEGSPGAQAERATSVPHADWPANRGGLTDDLSTIRRRHLVWLGLAVGAGLLLTTAAMLIPLRFSFAWIVFLTLIAIMGMTRLVSWLYRG